MISPLQKRCKPVAGLGRLRRHISLFRPQGQRHGQFGDAISRFRIALEKGAYNGIGLDIDRVLRAVHKTAEKSENRHVFFVCHNRV